MPGPLVGFGTDIDTDALYRRIVQLERFSQDPLNVNIGGGSARGLSIRDSDVNLGEVRVGGQMLPKAMTSPPTIGAYSTASSLTSPTLVSALEAGAFTYTGGPVYRGGVPPSGGNYPNYLGVALGSYPGTTSASPCNVDFDIVSQDATGRFELYVKGSGDRPRILVQNSAGVWEIAATGPLAALANDGSLYYIPVTMGAAGIYRIRLELTGVFLGVNCFATDTVRAAPRPRRRYIVVGDSFTEPTIVDSAVTSRGQGWVQSLAYLTGFEMWSAGSGGTGWLNPGSGGRQKFRDRLATDVIPFAPDGVIFAGGINDAGAANYQVQAEVAASIDQMRAALPNCDIVCLSPFWPSTLVGTGNQYIFAVRDYIQAAAASRGVRFLDLLSLPVMDWLGTWSSTLQSGTAIGANSISVATVPAYFKSSNPGVDQWYVYISDGINGEVRKVTNIAGTGPYTLSLANTLSNAHAAGVSVMLAGPQYMTGTGKQGVANAPTLSLGAASAGGTFAAGAYFWKVTAYNASGETMGSNEVTATLALNQQQALSWTSVAGATGYKLYRGTATGAENALIVTQAGTSYTDTGTAGSAATVPTGNTTGPKGDGNGDTNTGNDGTHPTAPGHAHIAYEVDSLWAKSQSKH